MDKQRMMDSDYMFDILDFMVSEGDGRSATDLASELGINRADISSVFNHLEKRDYLKKRPKGNKVLFYFNHQKFNMVTNYIHSEREARRYKKAIIGLEEKK